MTTAEKITVKVIIVKISQLWSEISTVGYFQYFSLVFGIFNTDVAMSLSVSLLENIAILIHPPAVPVNIQIQKINWFALIIDS